MSFKKIEFRREKHPEYWQYQFGDLIIKTDPYTKQDPNRVLCLGWACGIQMNYMSRHPEIVKGKRVFEPFAGSGPMGFLALKLGAEYVDLLDINPRALLFQQENAHLNQFSTSQYTLHEGDIETFHPERKYDIIFANPPFIPIPEGVSGTLHSDGGSEGNHLINILLAKLEDFLTPEGEAFFYAFQMENREGPFLLSSIAKHLRDRPVEITKGWEVSIPSDGFFEAYVQAFPEHENTIQTWSNYLQKTYGSDLTLNDYIVHVGPQSRDKITHHIRNYDGTKYAEGYFPPSEPMSMKSRVFENKIS